MKKFETILILCLLCSGLLYANPVDTEEARQKAAQFLTGQTAQTDGRRMVPARTPRLRLAHQRTTTEGQPAFYIFNNVGGGFVIVSGDDRAESILGYSDSGQFDTTDIPDGLADLLSGYEQQISHVSSQAQRRVARRADNDWADIEPMILTQWDQGSPFNALCPVNPKNGKPYYTGCVATALAQLLYYHQWPKVGYGIATTDRNEQVYSADLTQVRFNWDCMKPEYYSDDTDEEQAVATLMYHCALVAHAQFNDGFTDGYIYTSDLREHLGYKDPKWMDMSDAGQQAFEAEIYQDLRNKRPVLFSAFEVDSDGHEMLIDGYRSDGGFFHINFGWGGDKDGYYKLNAIDVDFYNFTTEQIIIYGIEPDYNAPIEANVYPKTSYQLSEDGTTLMKWMGDESYIHLGADAALWGVTEIGEKAFENCTGLEAVFIPSQITNIGENIFAGCTSLTSISVDEDNKYYHASDGLLINRYGTVLASAAKTGVVIPETVGDIRSQAFSNSTELNQITMLRTSPFYPDNDAFSDNMDYSEVTLYVPQQSLSQYRNHSFWSRFGQIVGVSKPTSKKLIVETTTGQKKEYMLYQMPVIRNNGTTLQLTTQLGQTVNYELAKLQRMTFMDNNQLGNANGKDGIDIADVAAVVNHLKNKTPQGFDRLAADINQDGRVDGDDVEALAYVVTGRREALARQDGQTADLGTEPAGESPDDAAMYIYRNDGRRLNAFLMNQVAYISYSCTGIDGITYDMPVVQLVQTRDSLYRIPIAAIDSISYQTPEPIMKKGLFIIDNTNISNVASVDFKNYTITFKSSTPNAQLPQKGQVIYSDLEDDPLPMGFSGRVTKVSGYVYTWESAGPEEVFDRLLMVGRIEPNGTHSNSARRYVQRKGHAEPSFTISSTIADLVTVSGTGNITLDYTFNLNAFNSEPATFYLKMATDFISELKVGYKSSNVEGALDSPYEPEEKVKEVWGWPVEILSAGPIHIDVNTGVYFSYGGEFSVELSGMKYKHTDIREYTWTADNPFHIDHKKLYSNGGWCDLHNNAKLKAEVAAKVSFGACAEIAAVLWKSNWMSLSLGFKVGPELKGSFAIDTDLLKQESFAQAMYKEFSENVKLTLGVKLGADLKANYKDKSWTIVSFSTTLFPKTVTLLPKLSKPKLPDIYRTKDNRFMLDISGGWDDLLGWAKGKPMNVKTTATNVTLFPGPIGLGIYDANGNELSNKFTEGFNYWHWVRRTSFSTSLDYYNPQTLKVYPQYKLLGFIPLKGEPTEIVIPKPLTLSASSVNIKEDEAVKVECKDGWGYYSTECSTDGIATVNVRKRADGTQYLSIIGFKAGTTTITVTDVRSGRTQTCDVTINAAPIKLSATSIKIGVGETMTVTASPMAAYEVESSDPEIASIFVDMMNNTGSNRLKSVFQITGHKAGTATIAITDPVRCRIATIQVKVLGDDDTVIDDDYDEGICGDPTPEPGTILSSTNVYASVPIIMPWNGEFLAILTVSDKSDMSHRVRSVRISVMGRYGNTNYGCNTWFDGLQPNTKYYWQVSYFDFESGTYRKCSPIWTFTTGPE